MFLILNHLIIFFFFEFLGGTVALGLAEPVLSSELAKYLLKYAPDAPVTIVKESPTAIYSSIPAQYIPGVVRAYSDSLKLVFVLGVPIGSSSPLSSLSTFFWLRA